MLPQQSKTLKEQEVVGSFPSDAVILSLSHNDESLNHYYSYDPLTSRK